MEPTTTLGEYLRKRRQELELTQKELGTRLGIAPNLITYWEKGQRQPPDSILKNLARLLELPQDTLYLKAHPEFSEFVTLDPRTGGLQRRLSPALEALKKDKELRAQQKITDEDITQLASIHMRGEIRAKEDYVFLLMSMRQVIR